MMPIFWGPPSIREDRGVTDGVEDEPHGLHNDDNPEATSAIDRVDLHLGIDVRITLGLGEGRKDCRTSGLALRRGTSYEHRLQRQRHTVLLSSFFGQNIHSTIPASVAQRANALTEPQCSGPGGVGSTPAAAGMSIQVSACYEIKFSGRYRWFAWVLLQM